MQSVSSASNHQAEFFPNLASAQKKQEELRTPLSCCQSLLCSASLLPVTVALLFLCLVSRGYVSPVVWNVGFSGVWMGSYYFVIWYAYMQLHGSIWFETQPLLSVGCSALSFSLSWSWILFLTCFTSLGVILTVQVLVENFSPWSPFVRQAIVQSCFLFSVLVLHPWLAKYWILQKQNTVWTSPRSATHKLTSIQLTEEDPDINDFKAVADALESKKTPRVPVRHMRAPSKVPLKENDKGVISMDFAQILKDNQLVAGISRDGITIGRAAQGSKLEYLIYSFALWMIVTTWLQGLPWKWISFVSGFSAMIVLTIILLYKDRTSPILFDVSYLQFYMAIIPYLPILFTDYIWSQYLSNRDAAFLIIVIYTVGNQLYSIITNIVVERLSAPQACSHYTYIVQQTNYFFQYAIFGPQPWSVEFLTIIIWTYTLQLIVNTGLAQVWTTSLYNSCKSFVSDETPLPYSTPEETSDMLLQELLNYVYRIKQTGQDIVAEMISLISISCFFSYYQNYLQDQTNDKEARFIEDKLWLRLIAIFSARILLALVSMLIFHRQGQELEAKFAGLNVKSMLRNYLFKRLPSSIYLDLTMERYGQMYPEVFGTENGHPGWDTLYMLGLVQKREFLYFFACASVVVMRLLHGVWST